MSRLTTNNKDNPILKDVGHANCKNICEHETFCDTCPIQEAIDKLAHYEDLEEQGRLIELPCKVGDTVYMIQRRYTKCSKHQEYRDEYNFQGCEELVCDSYIEHYIQPLNSAPIDWIIKMDNQFGKTVFLTKEEAEEALAGLKNRDAINTEVNYSNAMNVYRELNTHDREKSVSELAELGGK